MKLINPLSVLCINDYSIITSLTIIEAHITKIVTYINFYSHNKNNLHYKRECNKYFTFINRIVSSIALKIYIFSLLSTAFIYFFIIHYRSHSLIWTLKSRVIRLCYPATIILIKSTILLLLLHKNQQLFFCHPMFYLQHFFASVSVLMMTS